MQTFCTSNFTGRILLKREDFVFLIKSPESIAPLGKLSIEQKPLSMSKALHGWSVSCHLL